MIEHAQLAEVLEAVKERLLLLLGVGGQHLLRQTHPASPTSSSYTPTSSGVPLWLSGLRRGRGSKRRGRGDGCVSGRCQAAGRTSQGSCRSGEHGSHGSLLHDDV